VAGTGAESIHDGPLAEATFAQPQGITVQDGLLYVADSESSAVRLVDPVNDRVRRLVGRGLFEFGDIDARGDSVRLQHVQAVAATVEDGEYVVYLADTYNDKIKRLLPATREVTTVFGGAGHGLVDGDAATAEFWEPGGLSLAGRTLYIADTNNHAVRVADLDRGEVRTLPITALGVPNS
jgi:DNA-binding beta-propeller fold protein YncE